MAIHTSWYIDHLANYSHSKQVCLTCYGFMIMIMIRYWKDSTQCWLHPGGGGTLKTKRGLITTNLVQKYNY